MKVFFAAVIIVTLSLVSFELYKLFVERGALEREAEVVNNRLSSLESEQASLKQEIDYFSDVRNLAKELKTLFNYKEPNEHLLIIVPKGEASQ